MRIVEYTRNLTHNDIKFEGGHKYVMAEDIEAQYRNLYADYLGMSYPIETIYKPYKGQDLNGKKFMAFRTGGLGDMQFMCPAIRYLKKKYPKSFIRIASGCKQPLENVPEIDELYNMPFDAKLLEDTDYHLFFQGIIESSNEASKKTHAVDMFFSYFGIDSTHFPVEDKRPKLFFTSTEMDWLKQTLIKIGIKDTEYVIGIQMETSAPLRNFPKEKLKAVIDVFAREENIKIVLIGTEQHGILGKYYTGNNNNVILATKYKVRESIILANRYDLIIAPDTFMIQVAGALEKPLIGLYGPFPSEVRMKYFKNAIGLDASVVCNPCFKHDFRPCVKGDPSPCFTQITPDDVLQAADFLRVKINKTGFKYMERIKRQPNLVDIENYMLSADKGLCFFGGYYKHPNALTVDTNIFTKPDISDLSTDFKRESFPFVLYMGPAGFSNKNRHVYDSCKGLIRPGGYLIIHVAYEGNEQFFSEVKRDIGASGFVLLHSKFDPENNNSFSVVGRKPF